jgi:hypothetical protein
VGGEGSKQVSEASAAHVQSVWGQHSVNAAHSRHCKSDSRHAPVGSMAAKSGAEASAVKMPSRPSGATPML